MKGIPATTFQYRCRQVRLAMEEKFQEKDPEHTTIVPTKVRAETPAAQEPVFAKVNLSPEPHTASVAAPKLIQCNDEPDTPLTMNTPPY